ncbi:hypothetical protein CsSME_00012409 [Camellia sinensis var. sinensis]
MDEVVSRGGWQPVFRRRGMIKATRDSKGGKLFTVFVDNIPDSMNPKSLFQLFAKFGIVKDVFIPKKRRKITGSRFGFVRYDCSVAAEMAVQRADGLWCDDKALRVKGAEFKREDPGKIKQSEGTNQRAQNMVRNSHWADHRGGKQTKQDLGGPKSYAEVVGKSLALLRMCLSQRKGERSLVRGLASLGTIVRLQLRWQFKEQMDCSVMIKL